VPVEQKS